MKVLIKKWGGSAAIRLPSKLLTKLKLRIGDKPIAEIRPEGVMLIPRRRCYLLSDLIAPVRYERTVSGRYVSVVRHARRGPRSVLILSDYIARST